MQTSPLSPFTPRTQLPQVQPMFGTKNTPKMPTQLETQRLLEAQNRPPKILKTIRRGAYFLIFLLGLQIIANHRPAQKPSESPNGFAFQLNSSTQGIQMKPGAARRIAEMVIKPTHNDALKALRAELNAAKKSPYSEHFQKIRKQLNDGYVQVNDENEETQEAGTTLVQKLDDNERMGILTRFYDSPYPEVRAFVLKLVPNADRIVGNIKRELTYASQV